MTITELYENFGIAQSEFKPHETVNDFGRRVMSSNSMQLEQTGVLYSTGSSVDKLNVNHVVNQEYQLYSY